VKYYPDGVAEGTPEEIAAFKHIDAVLAARGKRSQLAIEGPKKRAASKAAAKKAAPKKASRRTRQASNELYDQIISLAAARDGITSREVAEYLEIDKKTAYNRLYHLRARGRLWLSGGGVFKVEKDALSHAVLPQETAE
jgi:DNA-binding NtrC family response regulator